jgi:hypothetical protein
LELKFPEKYQQQLKELVQVYANIEKTHQGCGKLALMEILADASHRTLLVVASSGTGKSAVMRWHQSVIERDMLYLDAVTTTGLRYIQKKLKDRTLSVLIDDLSKGGTEYSQVMTVCALGELIYSGFVRKYTSNTQIEIAGFHGSCIMNCQPLILKRILRAAEFETDIRDKVIRYYHLSKPRNISLGTPMNHIKYSYGYADINIPDFILKSKMMKEGLDLFRNEFTKARSEEHYTALIRASANVNVRKMVEEADLWLVNQLCKSFLMETELFSKEDLEGERRLDVNIIPLLAVLGTHHSYKVKDLMTDFQIKQTRLYQIIEMNNRWCGIIKNSDDKVLIPTQAGKKLLQDMGEW